MVAAGAAALLIAHQLPKSALEDHWSMIDKYCSDCHNDSESAAGLSFDKRRPDNVHADPGTWEKVLHKVSIGAMPPHDKPQPAPEMRTAFVNALEGALDAQAEAKLDFGTTTVRRLNRAEYANTIRDLFGIQADLTDVLPNDGGDVGFDNVADALRTSPLLLERYLTAALRVADMAIGNPDAVVGSVSYRLPFDITQDYHLEGLPIGSRGGMVVHHNFPADGEYVFSGRLVRGVEEGYHGVEGHDRPHKFRVLVDGKTIFTGEVGTKEDHELSVAEGINAAAFAIDAKMTSPRIRVTAGPHDVAFTWQEQASREQNAWEPGLRATLEIHNTSGMPRLEHGDIQGPYHATGVSDTPTRERIFSCRPSAASEAEACAEKIVATIATRAYRRAVDQDDIAPLMKFYNNARTNGGDFDAGIHDAVARTLVSPWFLFRVEGNTCDAPASSAHCFSDTELASRLSFFLWSSTPDDELLDLAQEGQLHEPSVLEAQVRRMVADKRADALVENFVGQWLQLRDLDSLARPDLLLFPDFDGNLRNAFRTETEMLFSSVLREDKSVNELMTADYTFVDERLARHYGIPGVYGSRFRKVPVTDVNRRGLFGQGSILSTTAAGSRTSPIIRGKFIVSTFWNNPPPSPPLNVPVLEASAPKGRPSTVRETVELHRANPTCAACHKNFDPVGFALENFDADSSWRTATREGLQIDAKATLADGTVVDGPVRLREALLARPTLFASTVTEKMLFYALGRDLEPADMPVVRSIVRNAAKRDYSLMSIVSGIVDSYPFQMRTNSAAASATATVAQKPWQ